MKAVTLRTRKGLTRPGFTLLEMVLALAIGVVLMWGLYNALNMEVQQAQGGRLTLEEATLARSVLTGISRDILSNLGPVNMFVQPSSSSSSSSGTPASSSSSSSSSSSASSSPSSSSSSSTNTTDNTIVFNNGVYGLNNVLVLVTSKAPRELKLIGPNPADPTQQATISDLRRISYWIMSNGDNDNSGLARQEIMQATNNDINDLPPDISDPSTYKILAREVKDIAFQYFDGVSWQDTWDGTTLGGPNVDTPIGPPSAIKITLTFYRKAPDGSDLPDSNLPSYSHVVAIPCGNNFPQTNSGS